MTERQLAKHLGRALLIRWKDARAWINATGTNTDRAAAECPIWRGYGELSMVRTEPDGTKTAVVDSWVCEGTDGRDYHEIPIALIVEIKRIRI